MRSWTDRLVDVPAFIIGNGPSLNEEPIELIKDFFSVGINRCFLSKLDPTILIWQDISLWNSEYNKLHNTQALKVARDVSDPRKIYYNFHLRGGGYQFHPETTHIMYGRGSTGPLAVQLAVSLGCRPLILLGMDCVRGSDGHSDFYGDNKHWTDSTADNCRDGLVFIKEKCPVEIYNCGANGFWPREKLKDILERIDEKYKLGRQTFVRQILGSSNKP